MNRRPWSRMFTLAGLLAVAALLSLPGCQTLREIANLRNVQFQLDRVADVQLAGIDVSRIRSYEDLRPADLLRLTSALSRQELPLSFNLFVEADNPAENNVQARLVEMDWTLLLDDTETISGTFNDNVVLPPGEPVTIPFSIRLDLVDFFDRSARDLVDLALALSGQEGASSRIALRAVPTIDTPVGPIRYPEAITIVDRSVGTGGP